MVERALESTKISIEVQTGVDSNQNPVYSKQSLFSLVEGANADKVVEVCKMIKPLLARNTKRNIKTEVSRIDEVV